VTLVKLAEFYNSLDAGIAKSLLDDADIGSVLFDTEMSSYAWGSFIPIRLMVLDEDLHQARQIIAQKTGTI
jgi:Putative prokaryotic signal transducing protein